MSLGRRLDESRLAFMMLSRLPMGRLGDDPPTLGAAQWAFPLVGVVIGAIAWLVHAAALAVGLAPLLAAFLCIGAIILATGALHFDGLADLADGVGGRDVEHRLEIMRDSRIGSYGVLALVLSVGLQSAALAQVSDSANLLVFLLVGVVSRCVMLGLLVALPPARADGLGASASSRQYSAMFPGLAAAALLILSLGTPSILPVALTTLIGLGVAQYAKKRLGGQTGDVLGAGQVMAETGLWIALATTLPG